jgi:hypothetical protein
VNAPEPLPCRWKHVHGEGQGAVYRATCGRPGCPGHLGDLSYRGTVTEEAAKAEEEAQRERRQLEREVARGESTATAAALLLREMEAALEESRQLRDIEKAIGRRAPAPGWCMNAQFVVHRNWQFPSALQPIYYGHADTGYRISHTGKRSRSGARVGRRPNVRPALPTALMSDLDDPRGVDGQTPRLPTRITCRICRTLNHLDWPGSMQDSQTR